MGSNYSHTTRASGLILTASIYNTDHTNHITSLDPSTMDDYSSTVAQMKTTTDPYPAAVESLATNLAGELARIRFLIKQITGEAEWYIDPDTDLVTVAAAGAGDMVLIETQTASASASLNFTTLATTYRDFVLILSNIRPATDLQALCLWSTKRPRYVTTNGVSNAKLLGLERIASKKESHNVPSRCKYSI